MKSSDDRTDTEVATLRKYLREISRYPQLTHEEELELARRVAEGDEEALRKLVESNLRFVVAYAKRYRNPNVSFLDLIHEGNLGLMQAARKYNPFKDGQDVKFITYAVWWIMQRLERVLAREQFSLRLPLHAYRELHKVKDAQARLAQLLHGDPRAEDLATETDMSVSKVERLLQAAQLFASLSQPVGEESELGDFLADDREEPVREAELSALKEALETALDTLPPRLALIVRLYYGLKDGHCYTLGEIGERLGISRERVRQLVVLAMRKLRHPCRTRRLRDFVRG